METIETRLNEVAQIAVRLEQQTGCPAQLMIAYAWLITNGAPYQAAWEQYQKNRDLQSLISEVASVYATDQKYARLASTVVGQENVALAIGAARQEKSTDATA